MGSRAVAALIRMGFHTTLPKCQAPCSTRVVSTSTWKLLVAPAPSRSCLGETVTPRSGSSVSVEATQRTGKGSSLWRVRVKLQLRKQALSAMEGRSKVTPARLAASRSTRPPPRSKGSAGVRPSSLTTPCCCAVLVSAVLICSGVQPGCLCSISAAEPAMWGLAMLVPLRKVKVLPPVG